VLDYVAGDEKLLIAFATREGLRPEAIVRARDTLAGPPPWTLERAAVTASRSARLSRAIACSWRAGRTMHGLRLAAAADRDDVAGSHPRAC